MHRRPILAVSLVLALAAPTAFGQTVRGGSLQPAPEQLLRDAVGDLDGLRVDLARDGSGDLNRVAGRVTLQGADLAQRMADFEARLAPLFGVRDGVELGAADVLRNHTEGGAQRVRLPQLVHGHEVMGHGLSLRLDAAGNAELIHGVVSADAAELAAPTVGADSARDMAETALAAMGHAPDEFMGAPMVHPVARISAGGPRLLHRVEVVTRSGMTPWVIEIDAYTGGIVRSFIQRETGAGAFQWDGVTTDFKTGKGKGLVYRTVKNARAEKDTGSSLKNLIVETIIPGVADDGMLTGRYSQVFNADGIFIVSALHDFSSADDSEQVLGGVILESEVFDHVNTYYWLDRMGGFFSKLLGDFGADYAMPALANFDDGGLGFANAFYSPLDLDGPDGYPAGYFVFGDFDNITGDQMDDMSRDPTIVCHEYTHGVVDQEGVILGQDELDTPPRAVNEAIADFAAGSFLKEPAVGPVFMQHSAADLVGLEGDSLRHLENERTMTDNLFDILGFTTDLPEEHEAGAIFGAALWRTRQAIKQKSADRLVFETMADWPQSAAEVGFPVVDTDNADDAYHVFFYECLEAMLDHQVDNLGKKGLKNATRTLGAFLAHGISGTRPDTIYTFDNLEKGLAANFASEFLGSIDEHVFSIEMAPEQKISITVTGDKKDATQVDFAFDDGPGDFTYTKDAVVAPTGTKIAQKNIEVVNGGTYTVTIANPGGEGGRYKLKLKLK